MGTPPPIHPHNNKAMLAAAVAAVIALFCIAIFYYKTDPTSEWMPRCAFKALTGYDCPGCGVQRALHAILHGNIAAAWHYNPFVFFAIPTAIFYIITEAGRKRWPHLHTRANNPWLITAILIAVLSYWLLRTI